jgi:hypothetical protein
VVGIRQDAGIDMHYDLVALTGSAGIDSVMQSGLGEQG